ncbi:hypothetical protein FFT87_10750 [Salinibacterium sp. M195]|nr:hypothetical protein FFT87_10750 [Salinibacterium sp. M195]
MIVSKPHNQHDYSEPFLSEFTHEWVLQNSGTATLKGRSMICPNPQENGVRPATLRLPILATEPNGVVKVSCTFETHCRESKATSHWTLIGDNDQSFSKPGNTIWCSCLCREHRRSETRGQMMNEESVDKWADSNEVKEYLGIGRETVPKCLNKRGMPAYKVGRFWRFGISETGELIRTGGAATIETTEKDTDA